MSHAEKGMPKEGADENQMPTSEGEAEKSQPEWLAEVASLISNSNNPFVRGYSRAMVPALQPKDIFQSIVAAQLTAAHTLALQQASAAATAEFLPQLEHFTRAFGELSRLTIELTNSYIKMQNNTQINQINIENVSVEKGAQAIVGCVTNAPTALAQSREADKEHLEVSRRRIRSKDRTGTS